MLSARTQERILKVSRMSKMWLVFLLCWVAPSVAQTYEVIDLGTLGGAASFAEAINNLSTVVGGSYTDEGLTRAFIWESGVMKDLGSRKPTQCYARGISDRGTVCGTIYPNPRSGGRGFVKKDGRWIVLGTFGGDYGYANAVNNRDEVVGGAAFRLRHSAWSFTHAFLWKERELIDLGTLGWDWSYATDINDLTQVVGEAGFLGGSHAFCWEGGRMTDLGTLGGEVSGATSINNLGQVAGFAADASGKIHACLWQDRVITDLGTLGGAQSWAMSINDHGQTVGFSDAANACWHAFIHDEQGMHDLNMEVAPTEWVVWAAVEINNCGEIVGFAVKDGATHAVLLSPK